MRIPWAGKPAVFSVFLSGFFLVAPFCSAPPAFADPIGLQWPQADGKGSPVFITYSFSNLLDGAFLLLSPEELRAATEESLRLWARYAPLHFIERPDSGPPPSDRPYDPGNHPQIRIGHHPLSFWGQAYYPGDWDGLAGDIHLSTGGPWTLDGSTPWHFLEVLTHELGHSLGLGHEEVHESMMNHVFPRRRYAGPGTAFLFPADIEDIQAIYGHGRGSVTPLASTPEPTTLLLVTAGGLLVRRQIKVWAQSSGRRGRHLARSRNTVPG